MSSFIDIESQQEEEDLLEKVKKERVIHTEPGFPPRHLDLPADENYLFLDISRQVQINNFRYWLSWARLRYYALFWNSPPSIHKHERALWLFPKPKFGKVTDYPLDDALFAQQRFCGPHTSALTRLEKIPPWLPQSVDLLAKIEQRSLFVVDYKVLGGFKTKPNMHIPEVAGIFNCGRGFVYEPVCLLVDGQIIDSKTPGLWTYAKGCFQVADAVYFFVVNRLCGSFLFLEPIVLHFFRCIHPKHPFFGLFNPLFAGHATYCHWVRMMILKEDGFLFDLMPLSTEGVCDLVKLAYSHWSFEGTNFLEKLSKRSTLDCDGYSYAEDGKDLHQVVDILITGFVDKHYAEDADVANDMQLQKWCEETGNIGAVRGFPQKITSKAELTRMSSHLFFLFMFDRSVVHRAPYDHMAFMPSSPMSIEKYAPHSIPLTPDEVLHLLSDEQKTLSQLHALFVFCNEIVSVPQWILDEFPEDVRDLFSNVEKQFQMRKVIMRQKLKDRPTPFLPFLTHASFVKRVTQK